MKTHKWIIILSFISTIAFFGAKESYRKNGVISQKDLKICELEKKMNIFNTITDSIERVDNTKKAKKFNFVFNSMKKYNPDIDKETVSLFISVTEKFNLDSTELLFNTCLSQILKDFANLALGRVISLDEHEELIMQALEEAKKKNVF